MICDWCSAEIADLGAHFASYAGKPCRIAALAEQPVVNLDGNLTHSQIRRRALRDLQRTNRRDRLEHPSAATYTRRERRGRA